jgi:mono/diheme cytochrome c family protein
MLTRVGLAIALLTSATAVWAADGQQIYDQKCKACHSIGGVGGPMAKLGGPLDAVGAKRDAAWLKAYFKDPKSKIPDSKMPKMDLPDADWDAVTTYLLTLKGGAK